VFVLRPTGAEGAPGDAAPERPHMRAVGRPSGGPSARFALDSRQDSPGATQQACRARARQALRKPHLACDLARSTNTVSSGSDVPTLDTRT